MPLAFLAWILVDRGGAWHLRRAVFLMPAVTRAGRRASSPTTSPLEVERTHYPDDPPGAALPVARAMIEGLKIALLALLVYLLALPFLFVAGFGVVIFFVATAYLLGRGYFEFVAMRHHSVAEAKGCARRITARC